MSDGEIQAHLSLIAVDPAYRRRGIARELIASALRVAGGLRIDLITDSAEEFTLLSHIFGSD
jgi:ribosomal protein S18 acetylase RimI-like enzyme